MKTKLENGQKLAPQFRTVSLRTAAEGEGQRVAVDQDKNMVMGVSVSSDEPYERYYGKEILVHTADAVDLTRFKKKAAPLLLNHNRAQLIGKPMNPRLEEGRLVVDLKFAQNALAQECLKDLQDGILTECSIGYSVTKFVVDEEEETYTAIKWEVFECSMVSIPADFTVGVGRELGMEEARVEIETKNNVDAPLKNENNDSQQRETSQHRETTMDPLTPEQIEAKAEAAKAAGQKEERERSIKITELSKHFAEKGLAGRKIDTSALAAQFIAEGKSLREFQDAVMVGTFKDVAPIQTPDHRELTEDDNGSQIVVIGERAANPNGNGRRVLSVGEAFVRNKGFIDGLKGRRKNISVELPEFTNFRATAATSTITSFNGIVQLPNIIELGVQQATVADLLSQGTTNLNAIPYLQEDTFTNAAATVAEGGAKPEFSWDWSQTSAPVKKIAALAKVTDELFADVPAMQSYINARMRYGVEIAEDAQLLTGDGTGSNITGILATSGIQTQAKGGDTVPDAVRKAMTLVQSTGFFPPDGAIFHPNDWEAISLLKDSAGQYLAGGPFYAPYGNGQYVMFYRIWGLNVVVTTSMTENTGLVGSFKLGAMIFRRQGLTMDSTNSNEDDFKNNLILLRAEERLALAVWRPKAFCKVTGI